MPVTAPVSAVVNGVVVSNFITLPPALASHDSRATALAPIRCLHAIPGRAVGLCVNETYEEDSGLSQYILFWVETLELFNRHQVLAITFVYFVVLPVLYIGLVVVFLPWRHQSLVKKMKPQVNAEVGRKLSMHQCLMLITCTCSVIV